MCVYVQLSGLKHVQKCNFLDRQADMAQSAIDDLVDDLFQKLAQGGVPWLY